MTDPTLIARLKDADVIVLDVDDNLYNRDSGLHQSLKRNILTTVNDLAAKDPEWRGLVDRLVGPGKPLTDPDLVSAWPRITTHVFQTQGAEGLQKFFQGAFDGDYSGVRPDPTLVQAVADLRALGKRVVINSNGAGTGDSANPGHVEKTLAALGFPPNSFPKEDLFEVTQMTAAGRGKPTVESALDMTEVLQIPAGARLAFFDDQAKNLVPFKDPRVAERNPTVTVWTHQYNDPSHPVQPTAELPPAQAAAVDFSVRRTGETLADLAKALKADPRPTVATKPRLGAPA